MPAKASASYSLFLDKIFPSNHKIIDIGVNNIPKAIIQTQKLHSVAQRA
jgi:hypothetical protein